MNLLSLFETPDQFLHSFDGQDAVFLEMDRDAYFRSIFTDRRISPKSGAPQKLPCADLFAAMENVPPGPIHYIFHIAHCGSTLLARALDLKDQNLVCREPFALRQLGVQAASGPASEPVSGAPSGAGSNFEPLVRLTRTMLGRRYRPAAPVIVKANVPVNFMIPDLMRPAPDQQAIFLYYALEDYLLAILRSPMHRGWVQHVSGELQPGIERLTGPRTADESIAVMAARLWLTQMLQFDEALGAFPHARSLSAEDLFEHPKEAIAAAFSHFETPQSAETIEAIAAGELFSRYSKDPRHQFDNAQRLERRAKLRVELASELDAGRSWAMQHANKLPPRLAKPLFGAGCDLLT